MERDLKMEMYLSIRDSLKENPEWLQLAIQAITDGMSSALDDLQKSYSDLDAAFLSALALCKRERISSELLKHLSSTIVNKIIKQESKCKLECDFMENVEVGLQDEEKFKNLLSSLNKK